MAIRNYYVILGVLFTVELLTVGALQCFTCESVRSRHEVMRHWVKEAPACERDTYNPSILRLTTCPEGGDYKCGFLRGTVSSKFPVLGEVVFSVQYRNCVKTTADEGCHETGEASQAMLTSLTWAKELTNPHIEGEACYCTDSTCDPGKGICEMSGMTVKIGNTCVNVGVILGIVGAIVIFLIFACICCRCDRCRNCCSLHDEEDSFEMEEEKEPALFNRENEGERKSKDIYKKPLRKDSPFAKAEIS